jgi:glycosyltransferase involved in cell wall biosynthesis
LKSSPQLSFLERKPKPASSDEGTGTGDTTVTLLGEAIVSREQSKLITSSPVAPKISVIMPAYNEQEVIAQCVNGARAHLEKLACPYEIVVVDDGSTDGTRAEAIRATANPHVRVVGYDRNQGKGFAIKHGTRHVTGDLVVFMDSDADVKPDLIKQYVTLLKENDIALASKWHPDSKVSTPVMRRLLSHAFNRLVMLLTGLRASDTQTGLKAFRREALERVMSLVSVKHYAFDVELLVAAKLLKLRTIEVPVEIRISGLFSARQVFRMFVDLLGITYRLRVIHWYQKNLGNSEAVYRPIIRW